MQPGRITLRSAMKVHTVLLVKVNIVVLWYGMFSVYLWRVLLLLRQKQHQLLQGSSVWTKFTTGRAQEQGRTRADAHKDAQTCQGPLPRDRSVVGLWLQILFFGRAPQWSETCFCSIYVRVFVDKLPYLGSSSACIRYLSQIVRPAWQEPVLL